MYRLEIHRKDESSTDCWSLERIEKHTLVQKSNLWSYLHKLYLRRCPKLVHPTLLQTTGLQPSLKITRDEFNDTDVMVECGILEYLFWIAIHSPNKPKPSFNNNNVTRRLRCRTYWKRSMSTVQASLCANCLRLITRFKSQYPIFFFIRYWYNNITSTDRKREPMRIIIMNKPDKILFWQTCAQHKKLKGRHFLTFYVDFVRRARRRISGGLVFLANNAKLDSNSPKRSRRQQCTGNFCMSLIICCSSVSLFRCISLKRTTYFSNRDNIIASISISKW